MSFKSQRIVEGAPQGLNEQCRRTQAPGTLHELEMAISASSAMWAPAVQLADYTLSASLDARLASKGKRKAGKGTVGQGYGKAARMMGAWVSASKAVKWHVVQAQWTLVFLSSSLRVNAK